jgi:hypothetical protein
MKMIIIETNMKEKLKEIWTWFWSTTTIDEQVEERAAAVNKQIKRRVRRVKEELADVKEAVVEVADQAGDVIDAAKGSKRKGRKPAAKKATTKKATTKKATPKTTKK